MCKHEVNWLIGTADGIVCKKCGKIFKDLMSLHAELEADRNGKPDEPPASAETKPVKTARSKKKVE